MPSVTTLGAMRRALYMVLALAAGVALAVALDSPATTKGGTMQAPPPSIAQPIWITGPGMADAYIGPIPQPGPIVLLVPPVQ